MATKKTQSKTAKNIRTRVTHEFPALFDANSEVLLLGSIPSPKSREQGFYYGHPQNRFWKVLASVLNEPLPATIDEKKAMLLKHHIASPFGTFSTVAPSSGLATRASKTSYPTTSPHSSPKRKSSASFAQAPPPTSSTKNTAKLQPESRR